MRHLLVGGWIAVCNASSLLFFLKRLILKTL
jgi:hypothetical protein